MYQIDVDFEVYKQLTVRRATEDVTYNDVVRELLGMSRAEPSMAPAANGVQSEAWVTKGVRIPVGTEFRAIHKGQTYLGRGERDGLSVNGDVYPSLSAAAVAITKTSVNGWRFWECRLPGSSSWRSAESLRS
ncbi:MAG: DUF2924 domain-containing protein [Burkholderiaceae bacterium]|jgi:predicted CopG family antitoxin|nr:DUF2924 domain-containing protein [Burkholderiaceae bacterium]